MNIHRQLLRHLWLLCILLVGILSAPVAHASFPFVLCKSSATVFLAGSWYRKPDGTKVDIPETYPILSKLEPLPTNSPPNLFMKTNWGFFNDTCTPGEAEAFAMMPHSRDVAEGQGHAVLKIEATDKENKVRYTYGWQPPRVSPFYAVVTVEIYPAVASKNCKPKYQRDDSIPALIGYDFRNCGGMGVNMTLEFIQTMDTCSVNISPVGNYYMSFDWTRSEFRGEIKHPAKPSTQLYYRGLDRDLLGIRNGKSTSLFTAQATCLASSQPPPPPPPEKKCDVVIKSSVKRR